MASSWSPVGRILLVFAAFMIVIAGMRSAESILVPFFLSVFIAVLCSPAMIWLRRKNVPTSLSILLVIGLVVVIGFGIGSLISASVSGFTENVPYYQTRLEEVALQGIALLANWGIDFDYDQWRSTFDPSSVFPFATNVLSSLGNIMTNAMLIILTVIFILAEESAVQKKLKFALPHSQERVEALFQITHGINRYMAIKAAISLLTGFLIWIWLLILGVDYAILWATLAFLLNFIPTFGSIIAAVPAVLLALVQLGVTDAALTAVGFVAVNTLVGNGVEPRVMGKGLGLSPLVVLVSLVFWGWVFGPVGMLLSVPLTMMVKIALETYPETKWIGTLLGSGEEINSEPAKLEHNAEST